MNKHIISDKKQCPGCLGYFTTPHKDIKYCSNSCRKTHSTRQTNERWVQRSTKKKPRGLDVNQRINFSRTCSYPSWLNKYNAYRG